MENLPKSIIKRIEVIINTTDLTNPNEIIKLAIEQENKFLNEMMEQKTERSKMVFKTIMKKTYATHILNI